jgi:preprotein translocase subunit YajC
MGSFAIGDAIYQLLMMILLLAIVGFIFMFTLKTIKQQKKKQQHLARLEQKIDQLTEKVDRKR